MIKMELSQAQSSEQWSCLIESEDGTGSLKASPLSASTPINYTYKELTWNFSQGKLELKFSFYNF